MFNKRAINKFHSKYQINQTTGCWEWTGSLQKSGLRKQLAYGIFHPGSDYKQMNAHRASWLIHNGAIPGKLCVLHTCDNPRCCNPKHLFLGTRAENMRDMCQKGRHHNGAGQKRNTILRGEADLIRVLLDFGTSIKTVSDFMNISIGTIDSVRSNKTHIKIRPHLTKKQKEAGYKYVTSADPHYVPGSFRF